MAMIQNSLFRKKPSMISELRTGKRILEHLLLFNPLTPELNTLHATLHDENFYWGFAS
jgi:hypothetical protein